MEDYAKLLQKAQEELPEKTQGSERFTIDKILGHLEGNKTVLANLKKIAKDLQRDENHLLKYLLRELATPGKFEKDRAILGTKVSASIINKKIKKYASEYVFCSECSKPETKLVEEKGVTYLKCQACGAKKPVKNIGA
ncbi:MAG: translation initiation factor IF-2 subunit beta [Nanoarchaeota archaeon]